MLIHDEKSFENISIEDLKAFKTKPFDDTAVDFLNALSKLILKNKRAKEFPDLITFGFFCRKSNLKKNKERYLDEINSRLGYGIATHICPSNIPINFAFSFIFGLLAGNSNIVRLPSKNYDQNKLLLELIDSLMNDPIFSHIKESTVFFNSERNSPNLLKLCKHSDCLIVWGGDETVLNFKRLEKKVGCVELLFPNRVSSLIIESNAFLNEENKNRVLNDFYNDTYLVDQNACSSPSNIFWLGDPESNKKAKDIFWDELKKQLNKKNYSIESISIFDKYINLMGAIETNKKPLNVNLHDGSIWEIIGGHNLSNSFNLGCFSITEIREIKDVADFMRNNEQTLTYFGLNSTELARELKNKNISIDRIVPIGSALDIGFIWDGKDVIRHLSRLTYLT